MVRKIKKNGGVTLLELLIVISIMAILSYFGIKYITSAMEKSKIESDLKKMYGLLQEGRIKAFSEKRDFIFSLNLMSKKACIIDRNTLANVKCINLDDSNYTVSTLVAIDKRGTFTNGTIRYIGSIKNLSYDCIVISTIRVKLGVWDGSKCKAK